MPEVLPVWEEGNPAKEENCCEINLMEADRLFRL